MEELKIIIKAVTDDARKEVGKVTKEIKGLSGSAKGVGGKISAVFKGVAVGAAGAVAAVAAVVTALVALGKSSLDAQKEHAKLNAAFIAAGSSAAQASESYNNLFRFLGDSGKATEAAAHLAQITTNQKDLAEWTKISQGIYATFGDSLPIEGLTEAANETIRVGKVTGTLADALNWAGVSEDEFNAKLASTNSHAEREAMLRSTLNGLYENAADVYEENNKALLDYNESQARMDSAMAEAGAAITPLLTAVNNLGATLFTSLKPAIDAIIPPLVTFVNWVAKAVQSVVGFFSALSGKSATVKIKDTVGGAAKSLSNAAQGANNLGAGMNGAEKAAEGAAKAIEEAKKSTMGFDELNVVSSGKSDSGSSSSTPAYASPSGGYATGGLIDSGVFETEITESENLATKFIENIKTVFAQIAEVFDPSIKAWSGAFETVKKSFNNAKPHFVNGAKEIKKGFSTLGNYLFKDFVPNVVNSFSKNLAPVIGDTLGFVVEEGGKHFEWLGEQANTTINDVIIPYFQTWETVASDVFESIGSAWDEHGGGLLEELSVFFETMRGHFENFYNNIFKPIWDKVLEVFNFVWTEGLKPMVDEFIDACLVIGEELLVLYNEFIAPIVDWLMTNIFPIIVNVVNGIIETVGNIVVSISNFIGGIIQAIKGIIQFIVGVFTGDWEKAWEGIKNFFSGICDAIGGIIDAVQAVFQGIIDFIEDIVVAAFEIAWETIKFAWDAAVGFFENIWDGICLAFSAVSDWLTGVFEDAWEGVKGVWDGVSEWFSNVWEGIKDVFKPITDWFGNTFEDAWQAVKDVFCAGGEIFEGIKEGILDGLKSVINHIIDGINTVIRIPLNGINSALDDLRNLSFLGISPFTWVPTISIPQIPKLAKGGIVDDATLAMIGEQGREAVVPLENNTGWMDKLAERIAARQNTPSKIVLQIGEKELGWATIDAINGITKQTGGLQLAL